MNKNDMKNNLLNSFDLFHAFEQGLSFDIVSDVLLEQARTILVVTGEIDKSDAIDNETFCAEIANNFADPDNPKHDSLDAIISMCYAIIEYRTEKLNGNSEKTATWASKAITLAISATGGILEPKSVLNGKLNSLIKSTKFEIRHNRIMRQSAEEQRDLAQRENDKNKAARSKGGKANAFDDKVINAVCIEAQRFYNEQKQKNPKIRITMDRVKRHLTDEISERPKDFYCTDEKYPKELTFKDWFTITKLKNNTFKT